MEFDESLKRFYPEFPSARTLTSMPQSYPPVLIEGLLRQGEILLMGGPPKRWKSWARLDMLYCIANGFDWLGFKCHKGLVVHCDFELMDCDIRYRFETIQASYSAEGLHGSFDNMLFYCLRGEDFTERNFIDLAEQLLTLAPTLFSLDPLYRLFGSKSENDQAAVNELLQKFLAIAKNIPCAVALLQHFPKGNQSEKAAQDRFSGSGVWSRFPDAGITFTDLEEENCLSVEFFLRSFKPIDPFAVRWIFPRFHIDHSLDPSHLKSPGRPKQSSVDQLCSLLTKDETLPHSELLNRATKILSVSKRTFERRLKDAQNQHALYFSKALGGYGLTPDYISKNGH